MMRRLLFIVIVFNAMGCRGQGVEDKSPWLKEVGHISFDMNIDDPTFKVCNEKLIFQYYNFGKGLQYEGEKIKINEHFKAFKSKEVKGESGILTIRFIVNCEGKAGRFRLQGMNYQYQPIQFNKDITAQLLELTKKLNGWKIGADGPYKLDYYQYLSFKIENGRLIEILP